MAKEQQSVTFDLKTLKAFKKVYQEAEGKDTFTFHGFPYVREYAKYVIEYLEGRFNVRNPKDSTKRK